jgi:hypothetical protein
MEESGNKGSEENARKGEENAREIEKKRKKRQKKILADLQKQVGKVLLISRNILDFES